MVGVVLFVLLLFFNSLQHSVISCVHLGQQSVEYPWFSSSLEGLTDLRKTVVFTVTVDWSDRIQIIIGNRRKHIRQARGHLHGIPVDLCRQ